MELLVVVVRWASWGGSAAAIHYIRKYSHEIKVFYPIEPKSLFLQLFDSTP